MTNSGGQNNAPGRRMADWISRCPICLGSGLHEHRVNHFFSGTRSYSCCPKCGAQFRHVNQGYRLESCGKAPLATCYKHKGKALGAHEWQRITLEQETAREAAAQQKKVSEGFLAALEGGQVEFIGQMEERSLVLRSGELSLFKFPVFVQEARVARYRADVLRTLDHGKLTVTSRRLVFSGLKRTIDMPLAELVVLSAFQNGIKVGINRSSRTKLVCLNPDKPPTITVSRDGQGETKIPLTGPILRALIQYIMHGYGNGGGANEPPAR